LFKKIADAVQLKKRDFKKPDHIPHAYDHKDLGHVITPEGLQPNDKLVRTVKDYSPPRNAQELKSF